MVILGARALRISFSKSLCEHIARKVPGASVARVRLRIGAPIAPGGASPNGLYAVCKRSGWPLRVTMFRDLAERWRHETRDVRECWIEPLFPNVRG